MAYILNQYNWLKAEDNTFMSLVADPCNVVRVSTGADSTGGREFFNEGLQLTTNFKINTNYYIHCKIKRFKDSAQIFNIKLINKDTYEQDKIEQFIKTIEVKQGEEDKTSSAGWMDVEFIFSPLMTFDTIVFELQRISMDYVEDRWPKFVYEELSIINNAIGSAATRIPPVSLIKLGVQTRPGLLMCINGEEIRVGRTGIYELKNGVMLMKFFAPVMNADDTDGSVENMLQQITTAWMTTDDKSSISSLSNVGNLNMKRVVDGFTLDYLYKED